MALTFDEALAYVSGLQGRGWRLDLDRMTAFVSYASLEDAVGWSGGPQFVHVAGTNGKGSTTTFVQSILHAAGRRVGGYYSPFVFDPRERIQINDRLISKQEFAEAASALHPLCESFSVGKLGGITEFEFKTAMGFWFWRRMQCEWVACEVGLGGRLDATNVLVPASTAIVSVGLDHVGILGETTALIAKEKAGIFKSGKPGVVGALDTEALESVRAVAGEIGAPLWEFGRDFGYEGDARALAIWTPKRRLAGLRLRMKGLSQPHNAAVAVAALDAANAPIDNQAIFDGLSNAQAPGRFQRVMYRGSTVILDGAHNAQASQDLAQSLRELNVERLILVTGMLDGHDPEPFYKPLLSIVEEVHVSPIDFFRAVLPSELAVEIRKWHGSVAAHGSVQGALDAAIDAAGEGGVTVVTGSFYLVGEVGRLIGVSDEPATT